MKLFITIVTLSVFILIPKLSADSLWITKGGDNLSIYADRKASKVGDIVTVVVTESEAASSTQSKASGRTTSISEALTQFFFPGALNHAGNAPSLTAGGKTAYTGGGSITNTQSVSSTAAVLVTDVLPNKNLVIEGIRQVTFSGETQYIILHGIIRPDDISSTNKIDSTSIAQGRIEFLNKGDISNSEKLGWFTSLYEALHPL